MMCNFSIAQKYVIQWVPLWIIAVLTVLLLTPAVVAAPTLTWNAGTNTVTITGNNGLSLVCSSDDFRVGPHKESTGDVLFISEGREIDCTYTHPTTATTTHLFTASENHPGAHTSDIGSLTLVSNDTTALQNNIDAYIKNRTVANGIGFGTKSGVEHLMYSSVVGAQIDGITLSNLEGHRIDSVSGNTTFTVRITDNGVKGEDDSVLLIGFYNSGETSLDDDDDQLRSFEVFLEDDDIVPYFEHVYVTDHIYKLNRRIDPLELPEASGLVDSLLSYRVTNLPPGFSFNAGTRMLTGAPTETGSTEVTYTATTVYGAQSTSLTFTITIVPGAVFEDSIWWLRADSITNRNNNDSVTAWASQAVNLNLNREIFDGTILDVTITPSTAVHDTIFSGVSGSLVGSVDTIVTGSRGSGNTLQPTDSSSDFTLNTLNFSTGGSEDGVLFGNAQSGTRAFIDANRGKSAYIINNVGTYQLPFYESGNQNGRFGGSVSVDGNTAVVGAYTESPDGIPRAGAAYVFIHDGSTWSQQAKLTAGDKNIGDNFGISVDLDGDTVIIGSDLNDVGGVSNAGAAYVFTRDGSSWSQQARLKAGDGEPNDFFGHAVSLDGDTALIGAYGRNYDGVTDTGTAYIFTRNGSTWRRQAEVAAADRAANDYFGRSVSVDGSRALIGAYHEDPDDVINAGSAYVFSRSGGRIFKNAGIPLTGPLSLDIGDAFGHALAADEGRIVIGSRQDNDGNLNAGAVYVFEDTNTDGDYADIGEIFKISEISNTGSNLPLDASDGFGSSVAVAGDRILVGAWSDDDGSQGAGAVYILEDTNTDGDYADTNEVIKISETSNTGTNLPLDANDNFGSSVAFAGNRILVGAPSDDDGDPGAGAVYVFKDTNTDGDWADAGEVIKISQTFSAGTNLTLDENDGFGSSVAVVGNRILVGAPYDDDGTGNAGAVYILEDTNTDGDWADAGEIIKISEISNTGTNLPLDASDGFGSSVTVDGNRILVGAWNDDDGGADNGAVYILEDTNTDGDWADAGEIIKTSETSNTGTNLQLDANDGFGSSVAVDGGLIFVGAHTGDNFTGSVYILDDINNNGDYADTGEIVKIGDTSVIESNLQSLDVVDLFGSSVAVAGNRILVGAPHDDDGGVDSGAVYILEDTNTDGDYADTNEVIKISETSNTGTNLPLDTAGKFGSSVAVAGNRILVGATDDDDGGVDSGAVYILEDTNTDGDYADTNEIIKISETSNTGTNLPLDDYDNFGSSVAVDGNRILVGAPHDNDGSVNAGAVYILEDTNTDGDWADAGEIIKTSETSNTGTNLQLDANDGFGSSVAVDGNRILVGAPYDDDGSPTAGAVYILEDTNTDGDWADTNEIIKISEISNTGTNLQLDENDVFGTSVAVAGNRILVGAWSDDDGSPGAGAVYILEDTNTDGDRADAGEIIKISEISNTGTNLQLDANDYFGSSVAVAGNRILVGAPYDDDGSLHAGAVYILEDTNTDGDWADVGEIIKISDHSGGDYVPNTIQSIDTPASWSQITKLWAGDKATSDHFGGSVSLDGDTALIGAYHDNSGTDVDTGAAYVFTGSGSSWSQQAKLTASDADAHHYFGDSVSLDGDTALIGADFEYTGDLAGAGAAYVFTRSNSSWSQQAKLTADDRSSGDRFGRSVSLDGDVAFSGAYLEDPGNAVNAGSVYVFGRSNSSWSQQQKLTAANQSLKLYSGSISGCGCGSGTSFSVADTPVLNDIRQNRTQFRLIIADSGQVHAGSKEHTVTVPSTVSQRPRYLSDGINGSPAVLFDGIDDHLLFDIDEIKRGDQYTFFGLVRVETDTDEFFPIIGSDDSDENNELFFGFEDIFTAGETPKLLFSQNLGASVGSLPLTVNAFEDNDSDINPSIVLFEHDMAGIMSRLQEIRDGETSEETDTTTILEDLDGSFQDYIGRHGNYYAKMRLGDLFVYDTDLLGAQEEQLETYIAMKYGLTLSDISRYINSDGAILYDGSEESSAYKYNITGIGEDEVSGIEIESAISREDGARLTISNPDSLDHGDFLLWGNNNALPTAFGVDIVIQNISTHLRRVWKTRETGDVGTVTVSYDASGVITPARLTLDDVVLLIGEDATFLESSYHHPDSVSGGVITYTDINFSGIKYITFALERSSNVGLGGVFAGLRLWLDADDESTLHTDTACTSGVPADDGTVQCWEDKSGFGSHVTLPLSCHNGASCGAPQLLQNDFMGDTNTLWFKRDERDTLQHVLSDWWLAESMTFFIVMRQVTSPGSYWAFFSNGDVNNSDFFQMDVLSSSDGDHYQLRGLAPFPIPYDVIDYEENVYAFVAVGNEYVTLYSDGMSADRYIFDPPRFYGRHFEAYRVNLNRFGNQHNNSEISEIIIYDEDIGICNLKEVFGYLSSKYASSLRSGIPGNVDCRHVVLWHEVEGSSEVESDTVAALIDQGPLEYHIGQATAANRPAFLNNEINRFDAMSFDGTDDVLAAAQSDFTFGTNERHYFFSLDYDDDDDGTFMHHGSVGTGTEVNLGFNDNHIFVDLGGQTVAVSNTLTTGVHFLRYSYYDNDEKSGWYISVDGEAEVKADTTSGSEVTVNTSTSSLTLGRNIDSSDYFDGVIAEMMLLATNPPRQVLHTINTYFAMKNGVTINSGQDYVDSNNTVLYQTGGGYAGFLHDIAGFGSDNEQNIIMFSSGSSSDDAIVRVEASDVNEVNNHEFLFWGNDNGLLQETTANLPPTVTSRIERTWRFKKTGDVGNVSLMFDLSDFNSQVVTPNDITLIIDSNDDFTSGATFVTASGFVNGVARFDNVSLDDGNYVSISIDLSELLVDIVDSTGNSLNAPSVVFDSVPFNGVPSTVLTTFGSENLNVYVENDTADTAWTLSIAAEVPSAVWQGVTHSFDFNDSLGVVDGSDTDTVGGQMTINPSRGLITASDGCTTDAITLGTSANFSEGVTDSIVIAAAAATAATNCKWSITGMSVEQIIPAGQPADEYTLNLVLSVTAS